MNDNFNGFSQKQVSDSFQAFLVEGVTFTKNEEYPILESQMISKDIPKKIMPFNKALNYRGDLSDTFIGTYLLAFCCYIIGTKTDRRRLQGGVCYGN